MEHIEPFLTGPDPYGRGWELPEGHLVAEDHQAILEYSRGVCVNLGTYKGRSSVLMSYVADKVITVDCYIDPSFGHDEVVSWLSKYQNITPVKSASHEASGLVSDGSVDFIFQDAGHSIGDVWKDWSAWWPKLKIGGVIGFHDWLHQYGQTDESMDVRGGVEKILSECDCEIIGLRGWTYLIRKTK